MVINNKAAICCIIVLIMSVMNISKIYAYSGGLTSQEIELFAKHPIYAAKAKECADKATEKTNAMYKPYVRYMGNGDAFRHAYWSALMTKKTTRDFAYKAGLAHEGLTPSYNWAKRTDDEKMDISNNYSGRKIGDSLKSNTDASICNRVKNNCTNGKLKRILIYAGKKGGGAYKQEGVWVKKVPYYRVTSDGGLK